MKASLHQVLAMLPHDHTATGACDIPSYFTNTEVLWKICSAVVGGEMEPSYENVEKLITINNAIVMDALGRLKAIDDPKDPKFLWTFSRLVSFWFRNRALHNYYWLDFIKGNDGSELSAPVALKHFPI